jgi:hypothetical protein
MLKQVKLQNFWSQIPLRPHMCRYGEVNQYIGSDGVGVVGYINTISRQYFLVIRSEPETDILTVRNSKVESTPSMVRISKPSFDISKYSHAIPGSLVKDPEAGKNKVRIRCTLCGSEERWVFTSDLFQVNRCVNCTLKAKEALRVARVAQALVRAKVREG